MGFHSGGTSIRRTLSLKGEIAMADSKNVKNVLSCVKVRGEVWAPQVEAAMAGEALRIASAERRRGLISVFRRSDTGIVYESVFEVYDV